MSHILSHLVRKPGSLISVRDCAEASLVFSAGVDVLDIKEPEQGSLGKADDHLISEIVGRFGADVCVSAALGELADCERWLGMKSLPANLRLAKCGLAETRSSDWQKRVKDVWGELGKHCAPVAVIYLDYEKCNSPRPIEIVELANDLGVNTVLFDTHIKDGTTFLDLFTAEQFAEIRQVVTSETRFVAAGSIRLNDIPVVANMGVDLVGVRGAVCYGDRQSCIDRTLVELMNAQLKTGVVVPR